jgi:sugar transferase (PEP-CTERM system associated)
MRVRLLGQYLQISTVVLVVLEAVLFFFALIVAALLRFDLNTAAVRHSVGVLWPRGLLFSLTVVSSVLAFGLYSARQRARSVGILVRATAAVAAGTAVTAVCFYLFPDLEIGRGVLGIAALLAVAAAATSRLGFRYLVGETPFKRRVLVFGAGKAAAAVAKLRRRSDQRGFIPVGFVPTDGEDVAVPVERLRDSTRGLFNLCAEYSIDEVVVAMDDRRREFPLRDLLECRLAGIDVTELLTFLERETGRVRIDVLNPSWMIFGEGFRRGSLRLITSRALDLIASSMILVLTSPVMLVVAFAIKLEDGWRAPIFYRQARVGLAGRAFALLKFRSMRSDAEASGEAQWAQKHDPRVTRVGSVTRKLRIDELPQLINVLRGEMSLVGPRPERPEFVEQLAERIPYYVQRHTIKPGITGWAQLCYQYGSSEHDALEKLQYDLYYIKNNSLLFDLSIILQTVEVVFLGKGAR